MNICLVIPAYNEEVSIAECIAEYREVFPEARIVVVDNNSSDRTAERARAALDPSRDLLLPEARQGKGFAVKTGLSRLDADIYILTDGDAAFPADEAKKLLGKLVATRCDMVVGDRMSGGAYALHNTRPGHNWGNKALTLAISSFAGESFSDVLSGLRIMSRPFVAAFDVRSEGFQIEAEMNILAVYLRAQVLEVPVKIRGRELGSESKLNTVSDGLRILKFSLINWVSFSPLQPFIILFVASTLVTFLLISRFIWGFVEVGLPFTTTAMLGVATGLVAILTLFFGISLHILGRNNRRREIARFLEAKRQWNARLDAGNP